MRISDWSSDVCSSDLRPVFRRTERLSRLAKPAATLAQSRRSHGWHDGRCAHQEHPGTPAANRTRPVRRRQCYGTYAGKPCARSEEHTSELQSLMRISYAVFCLKKKKNKKNTEHYTKKTH